MVARSSLAMQLETAAEGRQHQVQGLYQQYLRRSADAGALAACTAMLSQGGSQEAVVLILAESREYYRLATGT